MYLTPSLTTLTCRGGGLFPRKSQILYMKDDKRPSLKVVKKDADTPIARQIYGRDLTSREMLLSKPPPQIGPLLAEQRTSDIVVEHLESGALTPLEVLLFVVSQKSKLMQIEGERFQFLHEALVGGDEKNYFQLTPDEQARLDKQQGKFGYALDALEDAAERAATYIHPKMGPYDPNADRQTKLMIEGGLPDLQVEDAPPAPSVAKKEG